MSCSYSRCTSGGATTMMLLVLRIGRDPRLPGPQRLADGESGRAAGRPRRGDGPSLPRSAMCCRFSRRQKPPVARA